jgi:hypothetical protein
MHEVLAETFWKDSFAAVDAMLWDARLSPAFWVDALDYYVYLMNRIPHDHLGGDMAPLQKVTGRRPRWDHLRTFGCDVYVHIPNNDLAKVPGVPKGKKYIFVGFSESKNGFKVFDPERRTYHTVGNCYFYEDFSSRVDALRHHDQRRALMRRGLEPPIILDDFQDVNSHAVRNLFIEPDAVSPAGAAQGPEDVSLGGAQVEAVPNGQLGGAEEEVPEEVVLSQIDSLEKFLLQLGRKGRQTNSSSAQPSAMELAHQRVLRNKYDSDSFEEVAKGAKEQLARLRRKLEATKRDLPRDPPSMAQAAPVAEPVVPNQFIDSNSSSNSSNFSEQGLQAQKVRQYEQR